MYNLVVEGERDFARRSTLLKQRKISRDPLSGLLDGSNRVFHTQYYPTLSSGSMSVYVSGTSLVVSSVDYDTGEVTLSGSPSAQPMASYTFIPLTSPQFKSLLIDGFDEMQSRWVRSGYKLSSGSMAPWVEPTEDSAAIYLVYENASGSLCDPVISGSVVFSRSRTQINFYMACCEFRFLERMHAESAMNAIGFREGRGGASFDRQRVPDAMRELLGMKERQLIMAMKSAMDEQLTDDSHLGVSFGGPHSEDYEDNFKWQ